MRRIISAFRAFELLCVVTEVWKLVLSVDSRVRVVDNKGFEEGIIGDSKTDLVH